MIDLPTGQDVADFLGDGSDGALAALATQHVAIVTAMARAYTRGVGFDDVTGPLSVAEPVAAVIVCATARLVTNPTGDRAQAIDDYTVTKTPFLGWSLAETCVLNGYRQRAA